MQPAKSQPKKWLSPILLKRNEMLCWDFGVAFFVSPLFKKQTSEKMNQRCVLPYR
jgi:hypothetical protein